MAGFYIFTHVRAAALAGACCLCALGAACHARQEQSTQPEKDRQAMLSLFENSNGQTVDIRVGELFQVTLPENASTGYRWAIERYDMGLIKALASDANYPSSALGASGDVTFNFQATKAGDAEIVLMHWRHWEGASSVIARFRIRLHVTP